jgi:hypothetical protein
MRKDNIDDVARFWVFNNRRRHYASIANIIISLAIERGLEKCAKLLR